MQNSSATATSADASNANRARFDDASDDLLHQLLLLTFRLQETETLSGKARLACDELSRLLRRRAAFLVALDEQSNLLAASMSSQKEKDHLAFEAHLLDPPLQKERFYAHLKALAARSPHGIAFVANPRLYEELKGLGIEAHPPIDVGAGIRSEPLPARTIAHCLFETPTLNDEFGAYLVAKSRHDKVNLALYLGGGSEKICQGERDLDRLLRALEALVAHLAEVFENDEIKRQALQDNAALRAMYQLSAGLVASSGEIKREKDACSKLRRLCENVVKHRLANAAIALTLDEERRFLEIAGAGKSPVEVELEQALSPLAAVGKLPEKFWETLSQHAEKISDTYVALDAVVSDEDSPLAFPPLSNAFALLGHRQSELSITLFAPFFNQDGQAFGFLAYCNDSIPLMIEETIRAVESVTKIVENELQLTTLKASSILEFRRRRELAEQAAAAKLQEALNFSKQLSGGATRKEKIEATLKAICQKTGVSSATAFLFDENGDYAIAFGGNENFFNAIPKREMERLDEVVALPNRFALEAMLSCRGFELNGNFCFTKRQVERAMEEIVTGGSVPSDFQSPELLRENLTRFATSGDAFLLTPIRYRGETFGYFSHDSIKLASDGANALVQFGEPLSLAAFFARELAAELAIDKLKETSDLNLQQIRLTKDLTDALAESAKQFQSTASLEDRANFVAECLTERFGFQFASVAFYEDGKRLSLAAHRTHSQLANDAIEKRLAARFRKGLFVPQRALEAAFQEEFKVGSFYAYRACDVRKALRAKASGETLKENFGAVALKGYAAGDERVGIMIPICDDAQRRIGHVALGQPMLLNLGVAVMSLSERMKLVSVLVEQLSLAARNRLATIEKDAVNESLLRSEARYRNLVENVQYGFIMFKADKRIDFVNAALKAMLGYPMDAMKDKRLEEFAAPASLNAIRQMEEEVYAGKTQSEAEICLVSSKGEHIPFRASCTPQLVVGKKGELEIEGAFSALIDLRPQYEIEKKRRQLETIKNNFYAMVVHDMKVPLAAIYGYSEMMKDVVPAQMNPNHFQDIMTQIHRSAINITNLIQEILEFSKYESRAVTLELHLNDLMICSELVLEQNQFGLDEKNIKVVRNYEPLEKFRFDFTRIARVMGNLMSNAIKFSRRDSQIVVSIKKISRDGFPFALYSVRDFGEGIPETELESIFDAYRQAQSKHGSRGTGLGLSIAKQIVELHGGVIWAESVLGEGATLTFLLPMNQAQGQ